MKTKTLSIIVIMVISTITVNFAQPSELIVKLGTYENSDALRKALKKRHYKIKPIAVEMIESKFQPFEIQNDTSIIVTLISVADLGFKDGATYQEIISQAKKLGLKLCSNETCLQFCLQHKVSQDRLLLFAMVPILDFYGQPSIFGVENKNIDAYMWDFKTHLRLSADFIFVFSN